MFELYLCWIIYVQSLTLEGLWAWCGASLTVWKPIFSMRSIYRTSQWRRRHLVWSSEMTRICIIIWGRNFEEFAKILELFFVEKHESIHLKTRLEGNFKSTEEANVGKFQWITNDVLKILIICVFLHQTEQLCRSKKGWMPQLPRHHLFYSQSLWNLLVFRRKQTVMSGCVLHHLSRRRKRKLVELSGSIGPVTPSGLWLHPNWMFGTSCSCETL